MTIDLNSKFGRVVKKHLKEEYFIWLTTVDSKGMPQPKPVWFVWEDDSFLIYSQPKAFKVKHIQKNSRVSLHFNTADSDGEKHIIVFTGEAMIDPSAQQPHEHRAYVKKYMGGMEGLEMSPEDFSREYMIAIRIKPTGIRGWE